MMHFLHGTEYASKASNQSRVIGVDTHKFFEKLVRNRYAQIFSYKSYQIINNAKIKQTSYV
jgi:hypothetical protein